MLTEQFLILNFSYVHINGQNTSTTVIGFHSNGTILFVNITELYIERLGFVGAKVEPQNLHQGLIIDSTHDVYINGCYFMNFRLLHPAERNLVKISNTQTAIIESTFFMNNTGQALHVEADDVYITNSEFTRNDGGAVDIQSNNSLITSTKFNYNSADSGGAVEVVSGTVVITWCIFTNNKAIGLGGAIRVNSGSSVSIFNCELTNNRAAFGGIGGAIHISSGSSMKISNSELTNNRAGIYGGVIAAYASSVSISNSELTNNRADYGGAIYGYLGGSVSISNCELTNNRAVDGGAIFFEGGRSLSISNSKLTNNSAGSGVIIAYRSSGKTSIVNSTLASNGVDHDGVIYVTQGALILKDTNITNNMASFKVDGGALFMLSAVELTLMDLQHLVTIVVHLVELSVPYRVKYTLTQKE